MSLDPILTAPLAVQMHVGFVLVAICLGPAVFARKSRDRWHRRMGRVWVIAMAMTALTSFWISDAAMIGPFGPIHLLSVLTLGGLWTAVVAIRAGHVAVHMTTMKALYFWAIGVAGLFTFLPGRRMNEVFFANNAVVGFVVMAVFIGGGLLVYVVRNRSRAI